MINDRSATRPRAMSLKAYRKMTLKMIEGDFCIKITDKEREHAKTLKTEEALDQFKNGILNKYWG